MLTTEEGFTGLTGRTVDTANATGRVFDPPRFLRLPPGVAVVGPAAWKPVVLSRPSFQQLFGAVRFIAHVPFRAVIPGRIAMAIGDGFPPRIDDRHEPKDTPLIGCMVDAVVPQVRVADGVDGTAPAVEQITQALLRSPRRCSFAPPARSPRASPRRASSSRPRVAAARVRHPPVAAPREEPTGARSWPCFPH